MALEDPKTLDGVLPKKDFGALPFVKTELDDEDDGPNVAPPNTDVLEERLPNAETG